MMKMEIYGEKIIIKMASFNKLLIINNNLILVGIKSEFGTILEIVLIFKFRGYIAKC